MAYSYDRTKTARSESKIDSVYALKGTQRLSGKVPFALYFDNDGSVLYDEDEIEESIQEAIYDDPPDTRAYGTPAEPNVGWSGGLEEVGFDKVTFEFEPALAKYSEVKATPEQLKEHFLKTVEMWVRSKPRIGCSYDAEDDKVSSHGDYYFDFVVDAHSGAKITLEPETAKR